MHPQPPAPFHTHYHLKHKSHLNRLSRNKLIVTKHQSQPNLQQQHQINNQPTLLVVGNVETIASTHQQQQKHLQGDGSENDCLSDSTIEKMRLQVRMQREKVEDER